MHWRYFVGDAGITTTRSHEKYDQLYLYFHKHMTNISDFIFTYISPIIINFGRIADQKDHDVTITRLRDFVTLSPLLQTLWQLNLTGKETSMHWYYLTGMLTSPSLIQVTNVYGISPLL